jgi:hypothetical protein
MYVYALTRPWPYLEPVPYFKREIKGATRKSRALCKVGDSVNSGFGGLEIACWPLVPKFAG